MKVLDKLEKEWFLIDAILYQIMITTVSDLYYRNSWKKIPST